MSTFTEMLTTMILMIGGVAALALIGSKKAQFPQVIQSAASGFGNVLGVAESPVTGASYSLNLTYPGTDMSGSFGYG